MVSRLEIRNICLSEGVEKNKSMDGFTTWEKFLFTFSGEDGPLIHLERN